MDELVGEEAFNKRFKSGNTRLFMINLPSKTHAPTYLPKEQHKWAQSVANNDKHAQRSREKLKAAGVSYYVVDVVYDFKLHKSASFDNAYAEMSKDRQGRGIVMGFDGKYDPPIGTMGEIANALWDASLEFKADPDVSGYGTNSAVFKSKYGDLNLAIVRVGVAMHRFISTIHEVGHNLSGNHLYSKSSYKYDEEGLQSNVDPAPTMENTKSIIGDQLNRATLKLE